MADSDGEVILPEYENKEERRQVPLSVVIQPWE
jgi:hypothetical protein